MSALIERIKAANRRKARICRGEQRRRFGQRFGVLRVTGDFGLGEIHIIHSGEKTVEGGNLRDDFFVPGALET